MKTTTHGTVIRHGLGVVGLLLLLTANPVASAWAQSGPVTDDNIVERVTMMKTPADHQAIAAYYQVQATAAAGEVKRHEAMVKAYGGNGMKAMNSHCEILLQAARQEQAQDEALAKEHADMAIAAAK